jgi:hypothetical protein
MWNVKILQLQTFNNMKIARQCTSGRLKHVCHILMHLICNPYMKLLHKFMCAICTAQHTLKCSDVINDDINTKLGCNLLA